MLVGFWGSSRSSVGSSLRHAGSGSVSDPESETESSDSISDPRHSVSDSRRSSVTESETESSSSISDSRNFVSDGSSPLPFFSPLSPCTASHAAPFAFAAFDLYKGLSEAVDEASLRRVDINAYVSSHVEDESSNEFTSRRRVVFTRYFLARRILTCLWDASQCVSYALLSSTRYKT